MEEPPVPNAAKGMHRVAHEEFYATVGQMNVHPSPQGRWDDTTGYVTEWRRCADRNLVGISDGGTHLCPHRYWARKG